MKKKQNSLEIPAAAATTHVSSMQIQLSQESDTVNNYANDIKVESVVATAQNNSNNDGANKYENISDNGSEISDEGYRSLGLIQSNNPKRISLHSQASNEDADTNGKIRV